MFHLSRKMAITAAALPAITFFAAPKAHAQGPAITMSATATANTIGVSSTITPPAGKTIAYVGFSLRRPDTPSFAMDTGVSSSTSAYNYTFANLSAGTYNVVVFAIDSSGAQTSSNQVVIVPANNSVTKPTVTMTATPYANTSPNSGGIVTTATAFASSGRSIAYVGFTLRRADTPSFGIDVGSGPNASGQYSRTFTGLAAGTYTVVVFAVDNTYEQCSVSYTVVVN
jgi:uncharacterized protein (DUF2141 family)